MKRDIKTLREEYKGKPSSLVCPKCGTSREANPNNTTLKVGKKVKLRCWKCNANTNHEIR